MTDRIDYGNMMHQAMRRLIKDVLTRVAKDGLPGAHHFFITFDTTLEGVQMSDWLRTRYPDEMTIVIQHWFDDLDVTDAGFGITLNFGDQPERLVVPYDTIRTFVDPSVEFGLRFESQDDDDNLDADVEAPMETDAQPEPIKDAQIVSLDSFRKS